MNELERILLLQAEERSTADLEYLEKHADELSDEQKAQLETEEKAGMQMCKMPNESKQECSTRVLPQIMKDNPEMSKDDAMAMAEKMCSKECKTKAEEEAETKAEEERIAKEEEDKEIQKKELVNKKISLDFAVETKDLGDGEVETVISSGMLDRHGEKINVDGIDFSKYKKNNVVMWAHNYDEPPIGKGTNIRVEGKKLVGRIKFALQENPFAKQIYDMVKAGFINAVSIGFIPLEMNGDTYVKSEMVEFSVVPVPANPEALIFAKSLGYDVKKLGLDKEITKLDNIEDMNIKELLEKIAKDGIKTLTVAEVDFLNDHKSELSAEQKEICKEVLKEEAPVVDPNKDLKEQVEKLTATVEKMADPIHAKNISGQFDGFKNEKGEYTKEFKFFQYVKGVQEKDFKFYKEIMGKDAMNTTGNVVVPPAEFIQEIQRLEEAVGVGQQYATVRRSTAGLGLKYVLGDDDLEIYDTDEGGKKKSTKLTYKEITLAWRKFAGILPITDELSEDSAIDLWTDATNRFSRAYAKRGDELVFTEKSTGGKTKDGILNVAGTKKVVLSGSMEDLTYEDLVSMLYGVPTASAANGRFWLNREVLPVVMKLKDKNDRPLWLPSMSDGTPSTILGKPYTEVAVMPALADDDVDLPFIAFGDLKYVTLGYRTDLVMKMFDTGNVGDPDEDQDDDTTDINLLTDDVQVLRAVRRMNAVVRFPEAFSVGVTGSQS